MAVELSEADRLDRAVISLRNMIRDKPMLNRLLLGQVESSDEELRQCIIQALIDWNQTPPHIGNATLANHPNKYLLLVGAAIQAMTGAGIWHSREHMPSSDGGTSADDHAKAGEYSGWIRGFIDDYERKKSDQKTAQNISQAMGTGVSVPSEYSYYYSLYGALW